MFYYNLFENTCHDWIHNRNIEKCNSVKNTVSIIGTAITEALGVGTGISASVKGWGKITIGLLILFLVCFTLKLFFVFGFEHVNNVIIKDINEFKEIKQQQEENASFWHELIIEYGCLADVIIEVITLLYKKRERNIGKIYTTLTESIAQMITKYLGIERRNFAVNLYVYDKPTQQVYRVRHINFCDSIMDADEHQPHRITREEKYYYETNIVDNKSTATYTLINNEQIQEKLNLKSVSDDIKKQYSQYIALAQDFGKHVTLYAEVISFNGLIMGKTEEELKTIIRRTITPLFRVLSKFVWDEFRSVKKASNHQ